MKPKPLSPLNHFTVPCGIYLLLSFQLRMYHKHPNDKRSTSWQIIDSPCRTEEISADRGRAGEHACDRRSQSGEAATDAPERPSTVPGRGKGGFHQAQDVPRGSR